MTIEVEFMKDFVDKGYIAYYNINNTVLVQFTCFAKCFVTETGERRTKYFLGGQSNENEKENCFGPGIDHGVDHVCRLRWWK